MLIKKTGQRVATLTITLSLVAAMASLTACGGGSTGSGGNNGGKKTISVSGQTTLTIPAGDNSAALDSLHGSYGSFYSAITFTAKAPVESDVQVTASAEDGKDLISFPQGAPTCTIKTGQSSCSILLSAKSADTESDHEKLFYKADHGYDFNTDSEEFSFSHTPPSGPKALFNFTSKFDMSDSQLKLNSTQSFNDANSCVATLDAPTGASTWNANYGITLTGATCPDTFPKYSQFVWMGSKADFNTLFPGNGDDTLLEYSWGVDENDAFTTVDKSAIDEKYRNLTYPVSVYFNMPITSNDGKFQGQIFLTCSSAGSGRGNGSLGDCPIDTDALSKAKFLYIPPHSTVTVNISNYKNNVYTYKPATIDSTTWPPVKTPASWSQIQNNGQFTRDFSEDVIEAPQNNPNPIKNIYLAFPLDYNPSSETANGLFTNGSGVQQALTTDNSSLQPGSNVGSNSRVQVVPLSPYGLGVGTLNITEKNTKVAKDTLTTSSDSSEVSDSDGYTSANSKIGADDVKYKDIASENNNMVPLKTAATKNVIIYAGYKNIINANVSKTTFYNDSDVYQGQTLLDNVSVTGNSIPLVYGSDVVPSQSVTLSLLDSSGTTSGYVIDNNVDNSANSDYAYNIKLGQSYKFNVNKDLKVMHTDASGKQYSCSLQDIKLDGKSIMANGSGLSSSFKLLDSNNAELDFNSCKVINTDSGISNHNIQIKHITKALKTASVSIKVDSQVATSCANKTFNIHFIPRGKDIYNLMNKTITCTNGTCPSATLTYIAGTTQDYKYIMDDLVGGKHTMGGCSIGLKNVDSSIANPGTEANPAELAKITFPKNTIAVGGSSPPEISLEYHKTTTISKDGYGTNFKNIMAMGSIGAPSASDNSYEAKVYNNLNFVDVYVDPMGPGSYIGKDKMGDLFKKSNSGNQFGLMLIYYSSVMSLDATANDKQINAGDSAGLSTEVGGLSPLSGFLTAVATLKKTYPNVPVSIILNPDWMGHMTQEKNIEDEALTGSSTVNEELTTLGYDNAPNLKNTNLGYADAIDFMVTTTLPKTPFGWVENLWAAGADGNVLKKPIASFVQSAGSWSGGKTTILNSIYNDSTSASNKPDFLVFDKWERDDFYTANSMFTWGQSTWDNIFQYEKIFHTQLHTPIIQWQLPGGHVCTPDSCTTDGSSPYVVAHTSLEPYYVFGGGNANSVNGASNADNLGQIFNNQTGLLNITDNNVLTFGLTDLASLKATTFSDMLYNDYNGWQYSHLMQMKDAGIVAVLWGGGSTMGAFQNVQQTSGSDNYWLNNKIKAYNQNQVPLTGS